MLAHVTGWGLHELMSLPVAELADWCDEALALYRQLHGAN